MYNMYGVTCLKSPIDQVSQDYCIVHMDITSLSS